MYSEKSLCMAREQLVVYMHTIRNSVCTAIEQCLRDAALLEEDDATRPLDVIPLAQPAVIASSKPSDAVITAATTVAGVMSATLTQCVGLRSMCRNVIIAYAIRGWTFPQGFQVISRTIRKATLTTMNQGVWKQKVGEQLRSEGNPCSLDDVSQFFGHSSYTLSMLTPPTPTVSVML